MAKEIEFIGKYEVDKTIPKIRSREVDIKERLEMLSIHKITTPNQRTYTGKELLDYIRRNKIFFVGEDNIFQPLKKKKYGKNSQLDFFKSKAPITVLFGGNSSGKTFAGLWRLMIRLCLPVDPFTGKRLPHPARATAAFPTNKVIEEEVIDMIREWTPEDLLIDGKWKNSFSKLHHILRLKTGDVLDLKSWEQDPTSFALAGKTFIWGDEEMPQKHYNECLARIVRTGGEIQLTLTALYKSGWMLKEIKERSEYDSKIKVVQISIHDNIFLYKEDVKMFLSHVSEEERPARESGEFLVMANRIYPMFNPKVHVVEPFDIPKNWTYRMFCDPHDAQPFYFIWSATSPEGKTYVFKMLKLKNKSIEELAQAIKEIELQMDIEVYERFIDPITGAKTTTTGGQDSIIQKFADYGIYFTPAVKDKLFGRMEVKKLLNYDPQLEISETNCPKLYFFNTLYEVINDMKTYNYEKEKDPHAWHCAACIQWLGACNPVYRERQKTKIYQPRKIKKAYI